MSAYGPTKYDFSSEQKIYDFLKSNLNYYPGKINKEILTIISQSISLNNLNVSTKVKEYCYDITAETTLLDIAIQKRYVDLVEVLLAHGATITKNHLQSLVNNLGNNIFLLNNTYDGALRTIVPNFLKDVQRTKKLDHASIYKENITRELKIFETIITKTQDVDILAKLDFSSVNVFSEELQKNIAIDLEKAREQRIKHLNLTQQQESTHVPEASRMLSFRPAARSLAASSSVAPVASSSTEELELQLQLLEIQKQQLELQLKLSRLRAGTGVRPQ